MKNQKDAKEPPKADLDRFRGGQKLQNEVTNDTEMTLGSEKTHLGKMHISLALPMREGVRDLDKS